MKRGFLFTIFCWILVFSHAQDYERTLADYIGKINFDIAGNLTSMYSYKMRISGSSSEFKLTDPTENGGVIAKLVTNGVKIRANYVVFTYTRRNDCYEPYEYDGKEETGWSVNKLLKLCCSCGWYHGCRDDIRCASGILEIPIRNLGRGYLITYHQ